VVPQVAHAAAEAVARLLIDAAHHTGVAPCSTR
jgi:hypothetical protein